MNQKTIKLVIAFFCLAITTAGCAKKEMIKSEESITAPETAVETAPRPAAEPAEQQQPTGETSSISEENLEGTVMEAVPAAALKTVYFDFDSYVLSAEARDTLKRNAEWMLKNSTVKVQVQGNCDERGSAEYNLALGENRAKTAVKYLNTLGISPNRLTYISYGKEKPVDPGQNEAAWAKNRRADFAIIK